MNFTGKNVVLGVTGGIACYKSPEIVRGIRDGGGRVAVIMTRSATAFIKPLVFQALSERPVATSLFSLEEENQIGHIKIVEAADALLIAPATANIIGKFAHGIADDYLSTSFLACTAPVFVAPAMNHRMWENPAVQDNLKILRSRGVHVISPETGYLACGSIGIGRMAEPRVIIDTLASHFSGTGIVNDGAKPLRGLQVLVTAGPTRERIDPVRYLSNDSSGKMGYALAECCHRMGARVTLVSGPTSLAPPPGIETIRVVSAQEMMDVVLEKSATARIIIKAAAVSDFRVKNPNPQKTKKRETLTLELVKNPDILKELGRRKGKDQFLVGFAAESQNVSAFAKKKLLEKNLDLIVANNILQAEAGFNVDTKRVLLIDKDSETELPLLSKEVVAERIMEYVLSKTKGQSGFG